ncbi:CsbD family protein [Fodinibius sediminis]|uniref:General stress protein CsbD n=1 Tax=Fodinibius sediminis TaxID=1214077 RepID=A0A521D985_9BACT|nr:CsbD family protein [Fodinibius sediminis]SMO68276.1 hypothetical protein SAMN06265218_10919 [Fodinibius sediminis]
MSELITKENWQELKAKLIEDYAILTEQGLQYEEGKEEKLLGMLQQKLGKTKAEIMSILREYTQR